MRIFSCWVWITLDVRQCLSGGWETMSGPRWSLCLWSSLFLLPPVLRLPDFSLSTIKLWDSWRDPIQGWANPLAAKETKLTSPQKELNVSRLFLYISHWKSSVEKLTNAKQTTLQLVLQIESILSIAQHHAGWLLAWCLVWQTAFTFHGSRDPVSMFFLGRGLDTSQTGHGVDLHRTVPSLLPMWKQILPLQ